MKVRAWCSIFIQLVFDVVLIVLAGWVISHCVDSLYIPVNHLNKSETKKSNDLKSTADRHPLCHDEHFIYLVHSAKDRISTDSYAESWGANKVADQNSIFSVNKIMKGGK